MTAAMGASGTTTATVLAQQPAMQLHGCAPSGEGA